MVNTVTAIVSNTPSVKLIVHCSRWESLFHHVFIIFKIRKRRRSG